MSTISVIIPTYNMRRQLKSCIEHLSMQTRLPDEIIVIDDGSEDGTAELIKEYGTMPLPLPIIYMQQAHAGASTARNHGFAASHSEYVMFLDADVVLKKCAIKRLYETLCASQKIIARPRSSNSRALPPQKLLGGASCQSRGEEKGEMWGIGYAYSSFRWGWKKFPSYPFDAKRLCRMPYIHTTSLIRRDILPEKPFDEKLKRLQDWDLYLTLLERGQEGIYVPEILFTVEPKGTISNWLPSILYQIPFEKFGMKITSLEKYREAEQIVRQKHSLSSLTEDRGTGLMGE